MELKRLGEIGLTEGEVKVYLALLKSGATKTGPLALKAGVSSSKVYKILDRLEKKGLAGHAIIAGIKHYQAMKPQRLLDYIDEKQRLLKSKRKMIENMLPNLLEQHKLSNVKSQATIYEGIKGVTNFFRSLLEELKPGESYCVIGAGYGSNVSGLRDFFYKYHQRRANKKIKVKMLANYDIKDTIVETTKLNSDLRFLPQYLISNMQILFYKNKVFMTVWAAEPVGFLLENKDAVKTFRKYFEAFWKIAEKS